MLWNKRSYPRRKLQHGTEHLRFAEHHDSNTRDIIDSQNAGTRAILDYLCNEKISSLQAENSELRRAASQDRQSALLTTAMSAQTQQIINAVNPSAIPAYVVPNPNAYAYGCGCNTGCNC